MVAEVSFGEKRYLSHHSLVVYAVDFIEHLFDSLSQSVDQLLRDCRSLLLLLELIRWVDESADEFSWD